MAVIRLTGPDDARAAAYRHIPDPALLRAHGLFIVEGRLLVQRLLTQSRFRLHSLLLNDAAHAALGDALSARAPEVDVLLATSDAMSAIGGFDFHRGCLALVERPVPLTLADLGLDASNPPETDTDAEAGTGTVAGSAPGATDGPPRRADLLVVLEGIGNADNVGGIFRNAAAFGARAVLLGPRCCDPLYRKATRTSMGATLSVPFATLPDWPDSLATLRAHGFRVAALTPRPPAADLDRFAAAHRGERIALLLGAEGDGLGDAALAAATDRIVIPMSPQVDSLNVATAAGIALHRLAAPATR